MTKYCIVCKRQTEHITTGKKTICVNDTIEMIKVASN